MSKSETSGVTKAGLRLLPAAALFGLALAVSACASYDQTAYPVTTRTTTTEQTTMQPTMMQPPMTTTTTRTQQYTP
jgi:hypothetical protein